MAFNPAEHIEAAKVLGMAMMVLGAALLIFMAMLTFRKKCSCDD